MAAAVVEVRGGREERLLPAAILWAVELEPRQVAAAVVEAVDVYDGGGGMSGVETGSVHTGMGIMQTVSHRGPLDQLSRWPDSCKTRGGGGVFLTATSGATPVTGLHHNLRAAAFWHGLGPLPPPTPNHIRAASHDVGGGGQALPFWTTGTDGKRACGPDPPTWRGGGGFPT